MKKIQYYLVVAFAGLFGASCSDEILDKKPLDTYTESAVWNDANLAQGFVYNTYASVIPELLINAIDPDAKMGGVGNDDFTDNVLTAKSNKVSLDIIDKYFDAGWAKNNAYMWFGGAPLGRKSPVKKNSFEVIRDCNLIISKVAESEAIAPVNKDDLIAQGKMLRALVYYTKARMFGKYVIVDKVLTVNDELKLPRTETIKETYDFILKDLKEAAVDLPLRGSKTAGRLTKGAAYSMLAEVALHGAAYIETGKEEYYQVAKQASESLFELNYALDTDYKSLFTDYERALNSTEHILTYFQHSDATYCMLTPMQGIMPNMEVARTDGLPKLKESFLGWTKCWPTCDLVDDYLVADVDGIAKRWDETTYYQDWETNGGYVSNAIYNEHRDKRFFSSIVSDSTQLMTNTITMRIGGNMHPGMSKKGVNMSTRTGYFVRKGLYDIDGYKNKVYTPYHRSITRLGKAYLNYAEVMLRLNQPDVAIEYINKTRVDHGGLPALKSGLSVSEVWKWYKIERRVELFFENDRYWSLLRWGKEENLSVVPELNDKNYTFFEISADGKSFEEKPVFLNPDDHKKRFSSKRYLFPVPESERILNELYDQNPGW